MYMSKKEFIEGTIHSLVCWRMIRSITREMKSKKKKKTHINGSRDYKFTMHKMVLKHFFFKTIEEKRVCKTNNQMMRETHS
mgnify:FL=1